MKGDRRSRSTASNPAAPEGERGRSPADAKETAYRMLSYRDRTSREVALTLKEKGFSDKVVETTLSSLKEAGYLDDARFARQWVRSRRERRQFGPIRLKRELLERGIPAVEAEAALNPSGEEDSERLAEQALLHRFKNPALLQDLKIRQRAFAFLQRKGFPAETIFKVFKNVRAVDPRSEAGPPV